LRIAVPSGVGDTYWALSKLQDFRKRHGAETVELCVQHSRLTRALQWSEMVDFVDSAVQLKFNADPQALQTGFSQALTRGADYCFWPNAVIDRGEHIGNWLPDYQLDLDFEVKGEDPPEDQRGLGVVYPSSVSINTAWLSGVQPKFWNELTAGALRSNMQTAVIGSFWDMPLTTQLDYSAVTDLVARTTLKQVTGILRDARVVVGVISGMTILANHFKTPCVAICPDKFEKRFPWAWVKPDAPYIVVRASELHSAQQIEELALSIARK
jgi:hypothetical protein